ncbi:universal stress protein [Herbidospora sp. NEAU-GS84]|uniref:Universal stress protein n=1 Tax=Herbidospora solisilvae TaxID=2696284 RepID=A0A7C9NIC5_9ACTN|nr:universal stress protein [Herbidospora solisilvae]NAS25975.1 universal stress protein [Herbidospora solisilvae]
MIVVGVDGMRPGVLAAEWAAREAVLRGLPLNVVNVVPAWCLLGDLTGAIAGVGAWMRNGGEAALAEAAAAARRAAEKAAVETSLLGGDPRHELIELSKEADLLVVGDSGMGSLRGLLIGSVALGVAGHAYCDVVVVRGSATTSQAEVVVGVDGSDAQAGVLDFAFREAAARDAALRAVLAWNWRDVLGAGTLGDEPEDGRRALAEAMAGRRELFPDVRVSMEVVEGHPVDVLRQAAAQAELLVVGSRGHGALAGMVLGSVSQALLHVAPCPLAVVRTRR